MTLPLVFLALSLWGALFVLNAYRPLVRQGPLSLSAFFAGWLTSELPIHHIFWQLLVTVAFIWEGVLVAWPGWVGLGITAASWIALVRLVSEAQGVEAIMEQALIKAFGAEYATHIAREWIDGLSIRPGVLRLARPFRMAHRDVERIRNISYGEYGRRNKLDIYRHRGGGEKRPVILWVHGGGWVIGNKDQQGLLLMNLLASLGCVCVTINYRLSPRATFPDHIIDVKRAIVWVKSHIAEWGGDPDFIVLAGGSAGGHLSALAALTPDDPEFQPGFEAADTHVQGCVPFYGVFDFTGKNGVGYRSMLPFLERLVLKKSFRTDRAAFERASPLYRVRADAPPFFVVHGVNDILAPVGQARLFVEALRAVSKSPVAYAELPGAQHAFEVFLSVRAAHAVRGVARFIAYLHAEHAGAKAQLPQASAA